MSKKRTFIIIVVLVAAAILLWKGGVVGREENIFVFANEAGETISVTFNNRAETATLSGAGYDSVTLEQAVSASGARYLNKTEKLELWNKGNDITLSTGETILFRGSESK